MNCFNGDARGIFERRSRVETMRVEVKFTAEAA